MSDGLTTTMRSLVVDGKHRVDCACFDCLNHLYRDPNKQLKGKENVEMECETDNCNMHNTITIMRTPKHYMKSKHRPIDVINSWDLDSNLGNVIKYVARHKESKDPIGDIKKAIHYLVDELMRMQEGRTRDAPVKIQIIERVE